MISDVVYKCRELVVLFETEELLRGSGRVTQAANGSVEILAQSSEAPFTTLLKLGLRQVRVEAFTEDGLRLVCDRAVALPSTATLLRDPDDREQPDLFETYLRLRPLHETVIDHAGVEARGHRITLVGATTMGLSTPVDLAGVRVTVTSTNFQNGALVIEVEQPIDVAPILDLLSLFTRTIVMVARVDELANNRVIRTRLFNPFRTDVGHQNSINDADTATLAAFLAATYSNYRAAQDYNPATLIGYYWRLHTEQTHEIQLALAFILLEAFKFNWALNIGCTKATPIMADRKQTGTVRAFYTSRNKHGQPISLSFETLLKAASADMGLADLDTSFLDERNSLFHTGLTTHGQTSESPEFDQMRSELRTVMRVIDRILLTMLGYKGVVRYGGADDFVLPS